MTLLNRPSDGLSSVLIALRKALIAFGPQTESTLLELAAPRTVVPEGKPDMARKTLVRWTQLGFFVRDGQRIALSDAVRQVERDDVDGLRAAVLTLLLRPENNPQLTSDGGDDDRSLASDWTRATSWILAQDPFELPRSFTGVERLQSMQEISPGPFVNDIRWQGFVDWARFAGIGYAMQGNPFVLNPVFALRATLKEVFEDSRQLAHTEFLRRLQQALPVIDGGSYRVILEAQIGSSWKRPLPHEISPSLTTALLTLEATRELRLEQRSDAPQCTLIGRQGHRIRQVSHFVLGGAQ